MVAPLKLNLVILRNRDTERQRIVAREVKHFEAENSALLILNGES